MDIPTQPFAYLADVKAYVADTWDLTDDRESRMYWLNTFRESTTKTAQIGMELLNFANFVRFFTRGKKTDRKRVVNDDWAARQHHTGTHSGDYDQRVQQLRY